MFVPELSNEKNKEIIIKLNDMNIMYNYVNKRKGVRATQLASKGRRVSNKSRTKRIFQIPGMPGYFTGGTINGDKINFIYSVEHPSIESGLVRVRFQVYDNPDKSKIYAKNFNNVSAVAKEYFGIQAYCYNELENRNKKQATVSVVKASVCSENKQSSSRLGQLLKNLFERISNKIRIVL